MTGEAPSQFWLILWRFVSPVIMVALFVSSLISSLLDPPKYHAYNRQEVQYNYIVHSFVSYSVGPFPGSYCRNAVSGVGFNRSRIYDFRGHGSGAVCIFRTLF